MADQAPPHYDLTIRPFMIQAGRYRWDIRLGGTPVESSIKSFSSEQEAHMDGRREAERLTQISHYPILKTATPNFKIGH
jgi:hypothetical protein